MNVAIISSSVRVGRASHRVALFFQQYITKNNIATVDMLDLSVYKFPVFDERLSHQKNPLPAAVEFADKIKAADGVLIVTPEYNGGYPASLKNAIDLLYPEWKRKPVAIATASNGPFGGAQVITSLVFSLFKIGATLVPSLYLGPKIQEVYDEWGVPVDKEATEKRAKTFIAELVWYMEASKRMTT